MVVYSFQLGQGDLHDEEEWKTMSYKWSPKRLRPYFRLLTILVSGTIYRTLVPCGNGKRSSE
ncbi:hypothetical protein TSUD_195620 [Trifolium subterraneum]|nr:hypothetical protein TSUD_195620 [Trifolium subterraneum]